MNRAANATTEDYRENRDIINEIVLWKMNRRPLVTEELIDAILSLKEIKSPLQALESEKTPKVVEKWTYFLLLIRERIGNFILWIIQRA